MAELIQQHHGIQELNDAVNLTDEEVFVIGRIVHDLDSDAKLTESTLALETSRRLSDHSGKRILRWGTGSRRTGFLSWCGSCPKGEEQWDWFVQILVPPSLSSSPSMKPSPNDDSFFMYLASGPSDTDLNYKPWTRFHK
ncbi:hypothetical protein GGU11DRAFT_761074 [Lentinula aff. detonsa]|nr:hypothetical protein GGU11DRAFT_761074 [Lentinula aff. detonsa]